MQLGEFLISAFRMLPPRVREQLKLVLGAGGHSKSFVDALRAEQLGQTWKHPDRLFPVIQQIIETTGKKSLDDCTIMEYGSGFLMAEPLIYARLGAREVHAIDYIPLLQDEAFRAYANNADLTRYADLTPAENAEKSTVVWLARLRDALHSPAGDWYRALGIRYVAPFDILADQPPASNYDLIVSRSTLEHVPAELSRDIVTKLASLVRPGGTMFHYIHLADHRDIERAPYAFLAADTDYLPSQHDIRGNRLRASEWQNIFASITDYHWEQNLGADDPALLPTRLTEQFQSFTRDDLLINHFTIWGQRHA